MTSQKQKLGRVSFECGYVVDLNNKEMIEAAKEAVMDDIQCAFNNRELSVYIEVKPAPDADAGDIPDFLIDECE